MRGYRKREAHVHAGRVVPDRGIDELLDFRERHDLVEVPPNLDLPHAEDRPVQQNIFPTSQLGMEPRTDLEERADTPVELDPSRCRFSDAREALEEGAL